MSFWRHKGSQEVHSGVFYNNIRSYLHQPGNGAHLLQDCDEPSGFSTGWAHQEDSKSSS